MGASIRSAAFAGACLIATAATAQVRHQPRPFTPRTPHIRTESTKVTARVVDGACDTTVAMTLRNDGAVEGEKVVLLPLPPGASADRVEMDAGGKKIAGEILDEKKARSVYESIVARRRDPALLEYVDRGLLRLRVFPIPPRGTQSVQVRFRMVLPESGGLWRWEFPARAVEGGTFSIDAVISSRKAIKNVYSPVQGMDVARKGDHEARCSFECKGRPRRDPVLFYALSDRDFGLNILTYRKQDEDGHFLMMLSPKRDFENEKELAKSITFVLDTSGSMQGEKIEQARNALRYFLKSLKPADRFNLVPFSTEARPFAPEPVAVTKEKIEEAHRFAGAIEARGGTNIEEALTTALRADPAPDLVPIVVFLTDGLPSVGNTEPEAILKACAQANAAKARVFVFGVGHDVNTKLLDRISGTTRGARDYVAPGENLEVKVSALFEKLAHPVMTDLEIVCDKIALSRLTPKTLPDLFRGGRIVVTGRYKGAGNVAIRLRGKIGGEPKEFVWDATFPDRATDNDFVATLWAQRRVGQLLDAIRMNGQNAELVAEIRRLGREHGVVTPYTSHLIVEEGEQLAARLPVLGGATRAQRDRVARELLALGARGFFFDDGLDGDFRARTESLFRQIKAEAERSKGTAARLDDVSNGIGANAVAASKEAKDLAERAVVRHALPDAGVVAGRHLMRVQRVGGRVLHLVGTAWVDGRFAKKHGKNLRKVYAFTPEYFALLRSHKDLAKVLAFSTHVIVVLGEGQAVEILPQAAPKKAPDKDQGSANNGEKR